MQKHLAAKEIEEFQCPCQSYTVPATLSYRNYLIKQQAVEIAYLKPLIGRSLKLENNDLENDYFNQHLECTAPKCWSKYTTHWYSIGMHYVLSLIVLLV